MGATLEHAFILLDDAAAPPLPEPGGKTPLEAADIPGMDSIVRERRVETEVTIPDGHTRRGP
ncbi:MAG TPA: hypothetical protein PLI95_07760 [Polyangiaceae bacterium]|nr:hypothetical protein [Polyangiaceae bacterium]